MCAVMTEREQELTIAQAAAELGISVSTLQKRIKAGLIATRKEGREVRIRRSELQRYIQSTYNKPHDTDELKRVDIRTTEWRR